ncbi:MauE/DoxX family redox-associated membrane protein [Pseudonocardia sp. GCM10023141]|uniref:MauE/DoxX family redox-associated membrane protein n=1 Tax=Pseudonocardia sp. GCM10023141 TaxID=3252653 RepID=UPI0036209099
MVGAAMTYLALACRGVLGGVLLVSLFGKLRGREAYRGFVTATATLLATTAGAARVLAPLTIAAELAVVGALAVEPLVPAGFVGAGALLCGFTVALVRALRRGAGVPCRCFGASTTPIGIPHVVRNVALVAVAALGFVVGAAVDPAPYEPAGLALCALAVAGCLLVTTRLDDLLYLLR